MLKTFTKLKVAGVASVLGVALAASGAYAATGALTSRDAPSQVSPDAPGQVLKVSSVGPASDHASATAIANANPKARGLFGGTHAKAKAHVNATAIAHANTRAPFRAATMPMAAVRSTVTHVAVPAPQTLPAYHAPMQPVAPQPVTRPAMGMASSPMR